MSSHGSRYKIYSFRCKDSATECSVFALCWSREIFLCKMDGRKPHDCLGVHFYRSARLMWCTDVLDTYLPPEST